MRLAKPHNKTTAYGGQGRRRMASSSAAVTAVTACKRICESVYNGKRGGAALRRSESMYQLGYKYCCDCKVFFSREDLHVDVLTFCPCCSRRLRAKPSASGRYRSINSFWRDERDKHTI